MRYYSKVVHWCANWFLYFSVPLIHSQESAVAVAELNKIISLIPDLKTMIFRGNTRIVWKYGRIDSSSNFDTRLVSNHRYIRLHKSTTKRIIYKFIIIYFSPGYRDDGHFPEEVLNCGAQVIILHQADHFSFPPL